MGPGRSNHGTNPFFFAEGRILATAGKRKSLITINFARRLFPTVPLPTFALRITYYALRYMQRWEAEIGGQALDHESLLGSPVARHTPATSQPGSLPGVLPTQRW